MTATGKMRARLKTLAKTWGEWEERNSPEIIEASRQYLPSGQAKTTFVNNRYHVQVYEVETAWGTVLHAAVGRHGELGVLTWAELQRIKNELFGPERLAVEVYPPVSQLVDRAPMFHLWVLPDGFDLPFGLHLPGAWGVRDGQEAGSR